MPNEPASPRQLHHLGLLLGAAFAAFSCSSNSRDNANDAGPRDLVVVEGAFGDLPPGCPPATPNEKGVGAFCTMGGGQCKAFGNSVCSCDPLLGYVLEPGAPCFCIIPIVGMTCDQIPAGYCGSEATCCSYMASASACLPTACLDMAMCPAL